MKNYQNLRKIREQNELLQKDVAKVLGIYQQQYQQYEDGTNAMNINYYKALAKFYNISIDYLCGLTDIPRTLTGEPFLLSQNYRINRNGQIEKRGD